MRWRCWSGIAGWIREGLCHDIPGIDMGSIVRAEPGPPVGKPFSFHFILPVASPARAVGTHNGFNREARTRPQSPSAGFVRSSPLEVRAGKVPKQVILVDNCVHVQVCLPDFMCAFVEGKQP